MRSERSNSKGVGKHEIRRAVVISRLLCGHKSGVCSGDWRLADGRRYHATRSQKWLYQQYMKCVKHYYRPDYLIVNGGLVLEKPILDKREIGIREPREQARLAAELIRKWDAKEIFITYGAGKRPEVDGMPVEDYIARQVHATECGRVLHPTLNGVPVSIAYLITNSGSTWQHRSTPVGVQLVTSRLQSEEKSARLLIRSSPQYLCYVGFVDQLGVITPGWAGQTPAGVQKNPENIPKVGAICVNLPTPNFDYLTWDGPVLAPTIFSKQPLHLDTKQIMLDLPPYTFKHKRLFSKVETLVMTGDWHPGSVWALCPPRVQLATGGTYCFNKVQEQLYNRYLECVDEFKRPDVLLLNGDLLDGSGSIDSGRDIAFTNAFDQMRISEQLIKLWEAKHVLITYGSRYHVERDAVTMERILAERVHATEYGFILKPTLNGIRCSFAHEVPVGTNWAYRPTAAATQLVVNRLQNAGTSVQLLGRSHVHQSCYVGFSEQLGIITPCFQGQTPYMARKMPESKPKIGVIQVTLPTLDLNMKVWDGPLLPPDFELVQ